MVTYKIRPVRRQYGRGPISSIVGSVPIVGALPGALLGMFGLGLKVGRSKGSGKRKTRK